MLAALRLNNTRLVFPTDAAFPRSVKDLSDPPAWLFVSGDPRVLSQPSLAAVGTREPSEEGIWLARYVGLCFGEWQVATISGLATGIDQIVHEMSLVAGVPTIAVLGTGIFSEYPKGSADLRHRILEAGGAVITEYLPNEKYSAENFVRRNRLQAALGRVLIPIEWAAKSGTAHTVRYAETLQRPIAALRLRNWPKDQVSFSNGATKTGAIFMIPGEEAAFRSFVQNALNTMSSAQPAQLSLI